MYLKINHFTIKNLLFFDVIVSVHFQFTYLKRYLYISILHAFQKKKNVINFRFAFLYKFETNARR